MRTSSFFRLGFITVFAAQVLALPVMTTAQTSVAGQIFLRPHCENPIQSLCPAFTARDPLTLETMARNTGDILDMDIIFDNRSLSPVQQFSVWIAYDPMVLEGTGIKVSDMFPSSTPGTTEFDTENGYIKIEAIRDTGTINGATIPLARIVLTTKQLPVSGMTVLSLHDVQATADGKTFVKSSAGTSDTNLLASTQGTLRILTGGSAVSSTAPIVSASSAPVVSSTPVIPASSAPTVPDRTIFALLQVQNVRAGTDGSTMYVTWDTLTSRDLVGYNVYYGTTSGEYAQRRSVLPGQTSIAIRDLPLGSTYFAAVRGANAIAEESAFSQEVRLTVGDPRSSTSPLTGTIKGSTSQNPVKTSPNVPGATGLPPVAIIIAIAIGAAFTVRLSRSHS